MRKYHLALLYLQYVSVPFIHNKAVKGLVSHLINPSTFLIFGVIESEQMGWQAVDWMSPFLGERGFVGSRAVSYGLRWSHDAERMNCK
jgi:hypothetical protein